MAVLMCGLSGEKEGTEAEIEEDFRFFSVILMGGNKSATQECP